MRFLLKAAAAAFLIFLGCTSAHPLCGLGLDFFESPVARALSFCTQYNDATCFSTDDDAAAKLLYDQDNVTEPCTAYHQQFVCAAGDPYQAHLFNLESSEPNRDPDMPLLCQAFCDDYASYCPELDINCTALVGEPPYCYPVELPRAGTGGLEPIIDIPGALLIDYADPGGDYDLWASFDGVIYKSNKSNRNAQPSEFLRLDNVFNQGELGFLTFELDPDYNVNGIIWAYYSVQEGGTRFNVLSRFTPTGNNNDPWRHCEILRLEQRGWNHNGGDIEFIDRNLYLSLGDDAPQNGNGNAQDLTNLYGTVIRIVPKLETEGLECNFTYNDPQTSGPKTLITNNYIIPNDNPFFNNETARSEIYAYGFRNPWRTFQEEGEIFVGDVGQQLWEELSLLKSGRDYGWEALEGQNCFTNNQAECDAKFNDPDYEPPVYDYPHFERDLRTGQQQTGFSLTAGHIYSGSIRPDLQGKAILADFINENIWSIVPTAEIPWTGAELAVPAAGAVVTMRKDSLNETVVLTLGSVGYNLKAAGTQATPKNGVCEVGENCKTDPEDCPGLLTGPNAEKWCCADGKCDNSTYSVDCPVDCDASAVTIGCGNNICDLGENCTTCAQDCNGHTSEGNGGLQFCCVGLANFEVGCDGTDCTNEICLKNKKGNENRKFFDFPNPIG